MPANTYGAEYDGVVKTMQMYIEGCKHGRSEVMRPAFHADAGFFGYAGGELAVGTSFLFEWVDKNGPSPQIRPRFISVEVLESIAAVRLDVDGWSGTLAPRPARVASDAAGAAVVSAAPATAVAMSV